MQIDVGRCEADGAQNSACTEPNRLSSVRPVAPGAGHPECGSHPGNGPEFSSKILRHGGARANSGGPRPNSGGARVGAGRPVSRVWAEMAPQPVPGGRWYCVEFEPQRDLLVINQLRTAGFEVVFPKYRPAGRDVLAPALGRYMLVRFDATAPDWRAIPGMLGVVRLFSFDAERPIAIPDAEVERLVRLFGDDGEATKPALPTAPLAVGTRVRPVAGLLAGHTGVGVVEQSDGVEVRVRFGALPVTMAQAAVEVV